MPRYWTRRETWALPRICCIGKSKLTTLVLDGSPLTIEELVSAARGAGPVTIDATARGRMKRARRVVEDAIECKQPVYGVTTGLGGRVTEALDTDALARFSEQTVHGRAHAFGPPADRQSVRAAMIVRANTLLAGYSGADPAIPDHITSCLNADLTPVIGEIGSVGVGDLLPNASLGLSLIGKGKMAGPDGDQGPSREMMAAHGIDPLMLGPRDGLALTSHSGIAASGAAVAVYAALVATDAAQSAAALSLEAFRSNLGILDDRILRTKPLPGQLVAADGLRRRLSGSALFDPGEARRLQDPLSFRTLPQVHGAVVSALDHARTITQIEINGCSDNPVVLVESGEILSTGLFMTTELAHALDGLSRAFVHLAMAQVARVAKHLDPKFSDLPLFLARPGSESAGFAPLLKAVEALAMDLTHAAQPTPVWPSVNANGTEDCVAGAPLAAQSLRRVADLSLQMTAIELLAACQALEIRTPYPDVGPYVRSLWAQIRARSAVLDTDRPLACDIENIVKALRNRDIDLDAAR